MGEFRLQRIFARPTACERAPRRSWRRMRTPTMQAELALRSDSQPRGHRKKRDIRCNRMSLFFSGDPWENRTPVTAVKGRCLNRLTNGPMVAGIGFEPMTYRVWTGCSSQLSYPAATWILYHTFLGLSRPFFKKSVFFSNFFCVFGSFFWLTSSKIVVFNLFPSPIAQSAARWTL